MSSYAASPSFSVIIDLIKHDNQHDASALVISPVHLQSAQTREPGWILKNKQRTKQLKSKNSLKQRSVQVT